MKMFMRSILFQFKFILSVSEIDLILIRISSNLIVNKLWKSWIELFSWSFFSTECTLDICERFQRNVFFPLLENKQNDSVKMNKYSDNDLPFLSDRYRVM